MYKKNIYKILSNEKIAKNVFKMILEGDTQYVTSPGQFINIELVGKYLRRPISVCDYDDAAITIIYKVVGSGTEQMSNMSVGQTLDVLTGLGNGFDIKKGSDKPLIVGGGVGVPPLYNLAKKLIKEGIAPKVILGFNTSDEIFYYNEFKALGCETYLATADGSLGEKGFVTDVINNNNLDFNYVYTCGPQPMLKALYNATEVSGQYSFEEKMGCGFGACMGCSCKTKYGSFRVCKDGPILEKEDIVW